MQVNADGLIVSVTFSGAPTIPFATVLRGIANTAARVDQDMT